MHHFLAVLILFMAPTPDHPQSSIAMSGFKADSLAECEIRLGPTISSLSQKPGVQLVRGICLDVTNPAEKPV